MRDEIIEVKKVLPLDNYNVLIKFANGAIKKYNASTLLKLKSCEVLKDIEFFKSRCCIINGTLAWALTETPDEYNCIDLDPIKLYKNSVNIKSENLNI